MKGSDSGIYYYLGNITSHILHALPLHKELGGTFVVASAKAKQQIEQLYGVPVINIDDKPHRWMKPGRRPKRIHEYIVFDKRLKKTYEFLNKNARVIIFYELFEIERPDCLNKPKKIFLTHGNMLKSYMTMYPKRLEIIKDYDYMAALGPYMKQQFIEDGVDSKKLVDIGIARTDEVVKNSGDVVVSKSLRGLVKDENKKIISYLPTFWGASSVHNTGMEIMKYFPDDYTLLFRPHPQTPQKLLGRYESIMKNQPNITYLPEGRYKDIGLIDIFSASSAIIGDVSSVMLEAILVKKPLVFAYDSEGSLEQDKDYRSISALVEFSQKITFSDKKHIPSILERAVSSKINIKLWDETIKENFFDYEGNAVRSIKGFIESL